MFKKLLSNLPYNPSLIGQVSFYAKRLHSEASVRRAGVAMIVLAMFLQSFAVFSPPQSSLKASPNTDLINGGFSSKAEAVRHCRDNTQNFKKIMAHFSISCDAISNSSVTKINPKDHDRKLYSLGRISYGTKGETPVRVPGLGTLYARHFWSLNKQSSYKVLKGTDNRGKTFYIVFDCGNLVSIGIPTPPPPKDVCQDKPGRQTKPSECDICPEIKGVQTSENECKPCEKSQTKSDLTACIEYKKTAKNNTQGVANANGTTAKPGDVIEYTLTTTNKGKLTIKDYVVNEGISDVLDYADVVSLHGGTKGEYDMVTWPEKDIKAGKSLTNRITVKIKDPLPSTPASSSDPAHFDMVMTNVYGNTVEIKLPPSIVKRTEIATTELPNTGPGTSLAIGFGLTVFITYFFARTRLLAKELDTVRADFGNAGGY